MDMELMFVVIRRWTTFLTEASAQQRMCVYNALLQELFCLTHMV